MTVENQTEKKKLNEKMNWNETKIRWVKIQGALKTKK